MAYDWRSGASGALTGGLTGAQVGGPFGALVGGGVGALTGFLNTDNDLKKTEVKSPEQQRLFQQLYNMLNNGPLAQGYESSLNYQRDLMNPNSAAVQQFTQPYMNQFNQQTVPQLAERFAGLGAMGGGLSSSGFGQSLSSAGANLQAQLAALKAGLGQQAAGQLMNQYAGMYGAAQGYTPYAYQQQNPGLPETMYAGWAKAGMPGLKEAGQGFADLYQNYMPIIGNV